MPKQPNAAELAALQHHEAKPVVCNLVSATSNLWLELRYSSYRTLVHVMAWVKRFVYNILAARQGVQSVTSKELTLVEFDASETFLLKKSQSRAFPTEMKQLSCSPPKELSVTSKLLILHPVLGQDGLLRVGGRLSKALISYDQQHPIIISAPVA